MDFLEQSRNLTTSIYVVRKEAVNTHTLLDLYKEGNILAYLSEPWIVTASIDPVPELYAWAAYCITNAGPLTLLRLN